MVKADNISDHISNPETTHNHISSSCSELTCKKATALSIFLGFESVKIMILSHSFPYFFEKVIDNLICKDSQKFADVNKQLQDLQSSQSLSSNACDSKISSVKEQPKKGEKAKKCTWCKTRGRKFKGHVRSKSFGWKKYKELQAAEKETDKCKKAEKVDLVKTSDDDSSLVMSLDFAQAKTFIAHTSLASSLFHSCILNPGTSAYMSPFKESFISVSSKYGTITVRNYIAIVTVRSYADFLRR